MSEKTEILNVGNFEAVEVDWWEVRLLQNAETGEPTIIMFFRSKDGAKKSYALHQDAPIRFMAALGSCIQGLYDLQEQQEKEQEQQVK